MQISFYKYQGTGNDFIMIDNRQQQLALSGKQVAGMCHRRFGIGADGLILLEPEPGVDFRMVYFNSDGNRSSMCGNGGRCITAFARDLGVITASAKFLAVDGLHESTVEGDQVALKMQDVKHVEAGDDFYYLNTGSPHYVKIVNDVETVDVLNEGKKVRYNDRFAAEGTNVNFMSALNDEVFVRTYERGVEDETFSCGTGVTASALVAALNGIATSRNSCLIHTRGGVLEVTFEKVLEQNFYNIWLKGEAKKVFAGTISIEEEE
jgi:diaminopimelate epimerase